MRPPSRRPSLRTGVPSIAKVAFQARLHTVLLLAAFTPEVSAAPSHLPGIRDTSTSGPKAHVIRLYERTPLILLLITPSGRVANANASDIIRTTAELLERHTDFSLQVAEPSDVRDCRGSLGCMVDKIRHERPAPHSATAGGAILSDRSPESASVSSAELRRERPEGASYLLLMSSVAFKDDADQLSISLVDLPAAAELARAPEHGSDDSALDRDAVISERAILMGPRTGRLQSPAEVSSFLERVFREDLRPPLMRTGHWEPYGDIEIEMTTDIEAEMNASSWGHEILLDGVPIGATRSGRTRIVGVMAGRRSLRLLRADLLPFDSELDVVAHEFTRVKPVFATRPEDWRTVHDVVLYSGLVVAATGVILTTLALAQAGSSDAESYCLSGPECRAASTFRRSGFHEGALPAFGPSAAGGGLLLGPLGYSLSLTGAAWSLGSILSPDDFPPWLGLSTGIVVGVASYSLSAILEPRGVLGR